MIFLFFFLIRVTFFLFTFFMYILYFFFMKKLQLTTLLFVLVLRIILVFGSVDVDNRMVFRYFQPAYFLMFGKINLT